MPERIETADLTGDPPGPSLSHELSPKGVALAFMKRASRDTFKACATSASNLADQIEDGAVNLDAPSALRLLAIMFESSAEHE